LFLFKSRVKAFSSRRRYSDFVWLKNEVERAVAIVIPELPPKAYFKQLPFLSQDDGIFEADFIEERRQGLEDFINHVAGHPLVQNEKSIHSFLQEDKLDKRNFVPGKVGY
jgi:sorting nexin-3/12